MELTAILTATLAFGVLVLVITPLVWAIRTQHDRPPRSAGGPDDLSQTLSPRRGRRRAQRRGQTAVGV